MIHEHENSKGFLEVDEETYVFQVSKDTEEKMMQTLTIILKSIVNDVKNRLETKITTHISVTKNDINIETELLKNNKFNEKHYFKF